MTKKAPKCGSRGCRNKAEAIFPGTYFRYCRKHHHLAVPTAGNDYVEMGEFNRDRMRRETEDYNNMRIGEQVSACR